MFQKTIFPLLSAVTIASDAVSITERNCSVASAQGFFGYISFLNFLLQLEIKCGQLGGTDFYQLLKVLAICIKLRRRSFAFTDITHHSPNHLFPRVFNKTPADIRRHGRAVFVQQTHVIE